MGCQDLFFDQTTCQDLVQNPPRASRHLPQNFSSWFTMLGSHTTALIIAFIITTILVIGIKIGVHFWNKYGSLRAQQNNPFNQPPAPAIPLRVLPIPSSQEYLRESIVLDIQPTSISTTQLPIDNVAISENSGTLSTVYPFPSDLETEEGDIGLAH